MTADFDPIAERDAAVLDYVAGHTTPSSELLARVARETFAWTDRPEYMIDEVEGKLLTLLVAATGARRVLEVGTFTGYSALCMLESLPADGHLTTLELDVAHAARAAQNFELAGVGDRVTLLQGPAIDSLATLAGPFDFAFIDADKLGYPAYFDAVVPLMRPGGLIVADNVLRSGRVADAGNDQPDVVAMREFNHRAASDPRVEAVMLTVRDGITLIRRRG
jgi:caffeoyl-CoA O-methyltransferase